SPSSESASGGLARWPRMDERCCSSVTIWVRSERCARRDLCWILAVWPTSATSAEVLKPILSWLVPPAYERLRMAFRFVDLDLSLSTDTRDRSSRVRTSTYAP